MSISDDDEDWPRLADDPQWADVTPLTPDVCGRSTSSTSSSSTTTGANADADGGAGARVVAIQYVPQHREALGYFRAVLQSGERSIRVLQLTRLMIHLNQADYTAWQLRWDCLGALGTDMEEERRFTQQVLHENAKNYQLWNHRRKCAAAEMDALSVAAADPNTGSTSSSSNHATSIRRTSSWTVEAVAQRELDFAAAALSLDAKNYHAWAHRQFAVAAGGLWEQELRFLEDCIDTDVRNNSAWNQRSFVVQHAAGAAATAAAAAAAGRPAAHAGFSNNGVAAGDRSPAESSGLEAVAEAPLSPVSLARAGAGEALLHHELEYVAAQIRKAPRNNSPWHYLRGLFDLPPWRGSSSSTAEHTSVGSCSGGSTDAGSAPRSHAMGRATAVHTICVGALEGCPACGPAYDTLAEWYLHRACLARDAADSAAAGQAAASALQLLECAAVADPVRGMYWRHRTREVAELLS